MCIRDRKNLCNRQNAAKQAEEIIDVQALEFMQWLNSLDAVSTIRALRSQAELIQEQMIVNGLLKLKNGVNAETVVIETARNLTNKLIHAPSSQLRNASAQNRNDLLKAAKELYHLDKGRTGKDKQ